MQDKMSAVQFQVLFKQATDGNNPLPADAEQGDLLPFEDYYILEFLGLNDEHSERQLRKAILANLRDADHALVRLALTPAAKKVGVATYEAALPYLRLIRQRLEQFPVPKEPRP